ncbi:MAG: hypothetical protein ABIB97_01650 [Patescibacteria group bacterium]
MPERSERQGPPHDESIKDPDMARYVAEREAPLRDEEKHKKNVSIIVEDLAKAARAEAAKSAQGTTPSAIESDRAEVAYNLAQEFTIDELKDAGERVKRDRKEAGRKSSIVEISIIAQALDLADSKQRPES